MPLLAVENSAAFHAEVAVDESLSGKLRPGVPVLVSIESINRQIRDNHGDPSGRRPPVAHLYGQGFPERRRAEERPVRQGEDRSRKKEIILAPKAAVVEKGQLTGVLRRRRPGRRHLPLGTDRQRIQRQMGDPVGPKPNDRSSFRAWRRAVDGGIIETGGK